MKKQKTISQLVATAAMAAVSITGFSQTNLGASCGCPPVASRPKVLMSTLAVVSSNTVTPTDGDLLDNTYLDCSHAWVLDKKIYVPNGKVLTVQPGTVIYGRKRSTSDSATALVVSRGGKMIAEGYPTCQIVMTVEGDPMDGSMPINTATKNKWGGLVIAGQASNTLTSDKNGPFQPGVGDGRICVGPSAATGGLATDGLGTFEGFATSDFRDQFGVNLTTPQAGYKTTFDDNDNSGTYKYLSVRFAGAILQVGGELNGISLGSVGRGTIMDHIEVICAADDNMEFWGGTVNVKNATFMFGNDDMFDWDDGYSGKAQNIFAIKAGSNDTLGGATGGSGNPNGNYADADNGFEMDADDQQSGNGSGIAIGAAPASNGNGHLTGYRSHPVIYNCTMIGTNKRKETSDNTGMAAIMAKELTEGEIYNSVFANFAVGLDLWTGNKSGEGTRVATLSSAGHTVTDSYDNWLQGDLVIKNNTFIGCGSGNAGASTAFFVKDVAKNGSFYQSPNTYSVTASDLTKFTNDGNVQTSSVPGFSYIWNMNGATNVVSAQYNATPNPALTTSAVAPGDGFFTPENYRGAFESGKPSWLTPWAYACILQTTGGIAPCPTDLNADGKTDNSDFLIELGQFNQNCH